MSMSTSSIESLATRRASRRPTKVFKGHTDRVNSVAYFPDGQHIASGSNDKTVIIWDVESGRQDGQPLQHDSIVKWIAISPDGRRIASGLGGGGLVVWDALTRKVVHEIKGGSVYRLAYSPNGRWIATAPMDDERVIRLWDADSGRPGRELLKCNGEVLCVAFSPDGSRVAVGLEYGSFQVIDVSTGESVVGPIKGHTQLVRSVVYSPDGRLLVTASDDSSIRVWDSKTGIEVGKPMLGHDVTCISITADGRRIASAGNDKTVRVWDLETRLQVGHSFHTDGLVWSVAFSPDDRYVISGNNNDVCLWDTEPLAIRGSSSPPTASKKGPPVRARARSAASSILDLPVVPASVVPHQDDGGPFGSKSPRRPSFDSILDLPAVGEPGNRRPNKKRSHSTESRRLRLGAIEPQQHPPLEPEASSVQPAKPGHKWSRSFRDRWRDIRHRKSRVPTDLPDGSPRPPVPLHEPANAPASPELPTNQQARRERDADAQENTRAPLSRARPSRNQNEANVALGQADLRLYMASPRGREGRHFRARTRRGGVQGDSHSDTESEDSDEDIVCLDAICYWVCFRRRRHLQGQ
ncbi:WD40 repeat-like protein [Leucogyrophana mollusca]|uniref:WD40 repeat-like protein n=1 Tax=Leucogyrophana mollusca TaxID=85980 RepID=A0ACB8BBS9_9AGAM|nr:WD40 repeat-like protein [Leucogyrophana mollusca]